ELSPNVVHAAIATEDARFYRHSGIDFCIVHCALSIVALCIQLIVTIVLEHLPIGIENLRLRDKSHIFPILYHRQVPSLGLVECLHYPLHGCSHLDLCWRSRHKSLHIDATI
ncbi:MAG: transglycosylase domain-containing protein, partial [Muribaculaceae bacterium]|nr:transglycosylase domain-containing protein [Muribaculaceae bacterium]